MGWQDHRQTNFACNSIGPNFNKPRKRCNSNDANSIFEQAAGELHAKLTGRQRGRAAAETASRGPLHPLRGATPDQKGCTAYRSGAAQPVTRTNAESARTQAWLRCPRWFRDQRGHRMQFKNTSDAASQTDTNQHNVGGELHAKLLWPGRRRGLAGLRGDVQAHISDTAPPVWRAQEGPEGTGGLRGAVPKGLVGLAAVPVGGGGAWPGFEIDRSEPQARVWRSRGRATAHGHTKQPRPTARPDGTRNTCGRQATTRSTTGGRAAHGHTKQPGPSTHTKTPTRNRVGASEPPVGIEPTTYSLRVNRSAD